MASKLKMLAVAGWGIAALALCGQTVNYTLKKDYRDASYLGLAAGGAAILSYQNLREKKNRDQKLTRY